MNMPKLEPLPIKTKGQTHWVRIKNWLTGIRKWKLVEDWCYTLPSGEKVVVPKEFIFDGASIPRPLWGLLSPTGLLLIPGLIHDFAYRYDYLWQVTQDSNGDQQLEKYKQCAGRQCWDKVFLDVGEDVNGMKILDKLAWFALLIGGKRAWQQNRDRREAEITPQTLC